MQTRNKITFGGQYFKRYNISNYNCLNSIYICSKHGFFISYFQKHFAKWCNGNPVRSKEMQGLMYDYNVTASKRVFCYAVTCVI